MKHLFVTDMDGTLLDGFSRVSPDSAHIISGLSRRGALITVATARTPATVEPLLRDTFLSIPAIVMTGAAMWDRSTQQYVNVRPFAPGRGEQLLDEMRSLGIEPFIYMFYPGDPLLHVYRRSPMSECDRKFMEERRSLSLKRFHLDTPRPAGGSMMLLFATGPADRMFEAAGRLRAIGGCSVSAFTDIFGRDTGILEVFAEGVNKASAILNLKQALGADRLTVYGDNLNDLPMLAVADDAVAVANAMPEVRQAATRIIGANTSDAVARDILAHFPDIAADL